MNRVVRKPFGPQVEGTGGWINCINRSFVICTPEHILLRDKITDDKLDGCVVHVVHN
jgi:hypothetical protein